MIGKKLSLDRRTKCRELSNILAMLATQIDEHADDNANQLPNPWKFDDWLRDYRDLFGSTK